MQYTGIYWLGPVYDMGGYGNVSRNFLKAIEMAGIPVFIHPFGNVHEEIGHETANWLKKLSNPNIGDKIIVIRHGTPELFEQKLPVENVVKDIGMTIFETDRIPNQWVRLCNLLDEVWVPSEFNRDTFSKSGVASSKLKVVPYPIDVNFYYPGKPFDKITFDCPVNTFKFLYTSAFDYRKGYDILIRAFCEEFSADEDVSLILKIYIPSWSLDIDVLSELKTYIPTGLDKKLPQINLIIDNFSTDELMSLYQTCNAYISTDRANGWGMPSMEMMAIGKPAITINWSGSTQFMNERNSFLIEPEEEFEPVNQKLQQNRSNYYNEHQWPKIRIENIRKVMREVFEDHERREKISRNAVKDIHKNYSPKVIGLKIKQILHDI